ncbi:DNA-3-methyladenine glycosylase [Panacibacter microcysteis]|uniref:DNA-3-methyladenine glycosylase n=1 Tax=Panacibacter microcysteis TaxID=2793269 RepID=UPI001E2CA5AA|nr:DNA-3-methyladenine glycosylase [Panacibacter microcysteis]
MKRFEPNYIDSSILLDAERRLRKDFYNRPDVLVVAQQLIGKILVTNFDNRLTAARIVETEAYNGAADKASHAYNNRRTARTEIMFGEPGTAYVYLCYGIHHLFNVVSNAKNIPHAVLIRGAEPVYGIDVMLDRCRKLQLDTTITKGPGNVSKALGIYTRHTGFDLFGTAIFIVDDGYHAYDKAVIASARIGVDYAAEDALLPYRYYVKGNPFVSGKIK